MCFDCSGCKNSCCISKKPALNKADVLRIAKVVDDVFKYLIFRDDIQGRVVKGNKHSGVLTLRNQEDGSCIFYKNDKCTIYNNRPTSCMLYPYNPIFTEKIGGYDLKVETSSCKELDKGHSFKYMSNALRWRKERLEYDKIVAEYNKRENRDFRDFLVMLCT